MVAIWVNHSRNLGRSLLRAGIPGGQVAFVILGGARDWVLFIHLISSAVKAMWTQYMLAQSKSNVKSCKQGNVKDKHKPKSSSSSEVLGIGA
jgi:hypothetical protein